VLIVREANAVGTAYLRLYILPSAEQPGMRQLFRQYLDARMIAYEKLLQRDIANREFVRARGHAAADLVARGDRRTE
jgi:hypothetical protein